MDSLGETDGAINQDFGDILVSNLEIGSDGLLWAWSPQHESKKELYYRKMVNKELEIGTKKETKLYLSLVPFI